MATIKSPMIKISAEEMKKIQRANRMLLAENTDLKIRIAELEKKIEWLEVFERNDGGNEKCEWTQPR